MQYSRRISVDLDSLLKVRSTGVSVGTKPAEWQDAVEMGAHAERRIAVDVDRLLNVCASGVAVGFKPAPLHAEEPGR